MHQEPTMTPTADLATASTRRQLLRTGAIGAAAAAFLAACGTNDDRPAGQSGVDPTTTAVAPTVPIEEPSIDELAYDTTVLRTATSLELVVAEAYGTFGVDLSDPALVATAERFGADHEALAEEFSNGIVVAGLRVDEPNAWVQENLIDPSVSLMTSDRAILGLMTDLENMLAATYLAAVQTSTDVEWRSRYATIAAAAARRAALLGSGGTGTAPRTPLFPSTELVSNEAYLPATPAVEE
jgi:hypothetical protein